MLYKKRWIKVARDVLKSIISRFSRSDPDVVCDSIIAVLKERSVRAKQHEQMRQSEDYQASLLRLRKTTHRLVISLQLCFITASRWGFFTDNYLLPVFMDDIAEAVTTAKMAIENGALNAARRELRHMLEVAVNTAFVDEINAKATFAERIAFFQGKKVRKKNVDHIKDLPLRMLGNKRADFVQATINAWVEASNHVHPTKQRIAEKLRLRAEGVDLGFETTDMLAKAVQDFHDACSVVMVLAFETIGPAFTGDMLVGLLDADDAWPFHENEFIATVDSFFDYKCERTASLDDHIVRRQRRIRHHFYT